MDRSNFKRPGIQTQRLSPQPIPRPGGLAVQKTIGLDMELPGEPSLLKLPEPPKLHNRKRTILRSVTAAVVLFVLVGGLVFLQGFLKLNKAFKGGGGHAAALTQNVAPELLKGEGSGRVNILLMGRGGGNHDAPDLTDTLMLASIDPLNHRTTLLSLPRDLWVKVPNFGTMKLNAAWESGVYKYLGKISNNTSNSQAVAAGFDSLDSTIKNALGVDIDYHVMVDFQAFQQAVDTVGGVTVSVPTDLIDPTMAWENNHSSILAKAGLQAFDGHRALNYVRSRETSSDFARSERQRSVLLSLKSKVVNLGTLSNPLKLSGLVSAFGNNVQTDLSLSNANRLYDIVKKVDEQSIASISLAEPGKSLVTTGNVNGVSVVLPKAGQNKYDDIQKYIRSHLPDPYISKEKARILVLNGTSADGLASTKAAELKSYGYNVIGTGFTSKPTVSKTSLVDLTQHNKYTKNYLEERFNLAAQSQMPDSSIATNGADFVIILGRDEANSTKITAN